MSIRLSGGVGITTLGGPSPVKLSDLQDVSITGPVEGQFLKYNGTTLEWNNSFVDGDIAPASVAAIGTVTGSNLSGTNTGDQTITLTGDVTGSGTGPITTTLATVNASTGVFGSATNVGSFTVNDKGLVTNASNIPIAISTAQVTSGTFADARIAASNVTQHQTALTIAETQITDGTILARLGSNDTITGNWTFNNPVVLPLGSASLPSLTFTGDTNTGIYSSGGDEIGFSVGGTAIAKWRSVGLSVNAVGQVTSLVNPSSATDAISYLVLNTAGNTDLQFAVTHPGHSSAPRTAIINTTNSTIFSFRTDSTERMRIDANGRVGINTSSAAAPLEVFSGVAVGGQSVSAILAHGSDINFQTGFRDGESTNSAGSVIGSVGSQYNAGSFRSGIKFHRGQTSQDQTMSFWADGGGRADLTGAGQFRIFDTGYTNTNPSNSGVIHFVNKESTNTTVSVAGGMFMNTYRDVADPHYTAGIWFNRIPTAGGAASASDIVFGTGGNLQSNDLPPERMRLDSSGSLLLPNTLLNGVSGGWVGSASRAYFGYVGTGVAFGISVGTPATQGTAMSFLTSAPSAGGAGAVQCGSITVNSNTTAFNTSSDIRLKENIVDAKSAANVIDNVKIREFDWKSGDHQNYGVVAQELNEVAPEAVFVGNDITGWGVDYSKLVPHLIKYVQELSAKIKKLEGK